MTEVHREGQVSLHVIKDGHIELRESTPFDVGLRVTTAVDLRVTTADDPTLTSSREHGESGLSANEVCRRFAARADVDFETAAAAVLDELEESTER